MPAIAAIDVPSAHANIDVRPGRAPLSAARSRWSTTARIAIAEPRPVEQQPHHHREPEPGDDRDEPVPRHERLADGEALECRRRCGIERPRVGIPDAHREAHEREHETDRHHELGHERRGR